MFYRFIRAVVRVLLFIFNGNAHYQGKENLPQDQNYILAGPHRAWWDSIYLALGASPKEFSFMAKEELFKNPLLRWILIHAHAFPVNRQNPGPSAIKTPVKRLKNENLGLIMFPSGSRYSDDLKGGIALISKMAKAPIVPVVYQGPLKFSHLFLRKKVVIRYGKPINISDIQKIDKEGIKIIEERMNAAFKQLDNEINPDFKDPLKQGKH